ncbi:M15 family metallopeptidase [Microlunatus elymi]|uniref:M15 family metallopeptidase n=1 Tax=Microlunatus elymi TaxID=2596828 RepID=A0A516PTS8_9ACTN|nr:M15 family metallopeptidase [Microlunatus elymi]QDP94563.1 M15 family metallopeptidase [Microlunatus elymi]
MSFSEPAPHRPPRLRSVVLVVLTVGIFATLVGVLGHRSASAPSAAITPETVRPVAHGRQNGAKKHGAPDARAGDNQHATIGPADGVLRDGVTVFDTVNPGVTKLQPQLLAALRRAATDAGRGRITFYVNSGWRSKAYQDQLFAEAVAKYGSTAEAARWVARPGTSVHEAGEAVDLGESDATTWLSRNGSKYGLCQIYRNETWHFELRPDAIDHGCPPMYADPTQDARLQR